MSQTDYASIEPLIASSDVKGSSLTVLFRCPDSGVEASGTARLQKLDDFKNQAARTVKKNLWSGLRRSATRAVADTLGEGMAGKIAKDLAGTGLRQAEKSTAFSQQEVEAATVAAFDSVKAGFRWDDARQVWSGESVSC